MKATPIRLAAAGAALWLAATAAQANIFVLDRREQRDGALPPYRSVGVLYHPATRSGGTAFLVGRCHVMTAFHVAFMRDFDAAAGEPGVDRAKAGHSAEFLIGPDAKVAGRFAATTSARVVAFGRFRPADYRGMAGDWALLRLDRCLGEHYGFLALASAAGEPMPKGELMTAGFPHSRRHKPGITIEIGCKARDHGPVSGLVGVDCAFENGMSGGPVWEKQADGRWRVVGLIQQSLGAVGHALPAYAMEHRNQMLAASEFRAAVKRALRSEAKRALARDHVTAVSAAVRRRNSRLAFVIDVSCLEPAARAATLPTSGAAMRDASAGRHHRPRRPPALLRTRQALRS